MVSGRIALVWHKSVYLSKIFTTRMFPTYAQRFPHELIVHTGYAEIIEQLLQNTQNPRDFTNGLQEFNRNFYYDTIPLFTKYPLKATMFDFTKQYQQKWGSEYVYFKNLSGRTLHLTLKHLTTPVSAVDYFPQQSAIPVILANQGIGITDWGDYLNVYQRCYPEHLTNDIVLPFILKKQCVTQTQKH